jgi:hypothetical protein
MKLRIALAILVLTSSTFAADSHPNSAPDAVAFARLKSLVGEWNGDTNLGKVHLSYELASGGNVLLEHARVANMHDDMITAYYLDGGHLVLTHYCTIGTQWKMIARQIDLQNGNILFELASGDNPESARMHMHSATITLVDDGHFSNSWTLFEKSKPKVTLHGKYDRAVASSLRMQLSFLRMLWKLQTSTGWSAQ